MKMRIYLKKCIPGSNRSCLYYVKHLPISYRAYLSVHQPREVHGRAVLNLVLNRIPYW